jgi:triosephosphate isomerase
VTKVAAGRTGRLLVVANWKCHKTSGEASRWLDTFAAGYRPDPAIDIVIAPTMLSLEGVARHLQSLALAGVTLAAQDVSPFPRGGYTGAVAADMLKGLAEYVIIGHSDRRRYFHETAADVTNKVSEAVEAGLRPIVCVDRPYAVQQLAALADFDTSQTIVAYSPVDALSFRIPESPEGVREAATEIRNSFPNRAIIYGGSLTPDNVGDYLLLGELAGIFVGSASLEVNDFLTICHQAQSVVQQKTNTK